MKKNKYIIGLITISILGLTLQTAFPAVTYAVNPTSDTKSTETTTTTTTTTADKTNATTGTTAQTQRISNLKTRATTEITKRLTALTSLISKISSIKKLSNTQKSTFTSDIQGNINDLTALKSKIDADTDAATLQSDVRSIVENYRIFALYVPKIHLLSGANIVAEIATNLNGLAAKFQTRITEEQQAGKDTTSLQAAVVQLQAEIGTISESAQTITDSVISLDPTEYPGNITDLQTAQQSLKTAKANIQTARQNAQKIIDSIKNLQK